MDFFLLWIQLCLCFNSINNPLLINPWKRIRLRGSYECLKEIHLATRDLVHPKIHQYRGREGFEPMGYREFYNVEEHGEYGTKTKPNKFPIIYKMVTITKEKEGIERGIHMKGKKGH